MITTTTHPAEALCPRCGDVVLRVAGRLLTREPVVGGLYELAGRPELLRTRRRGWREMAAEFSARTRVHGGGHDLHTCVEDEHWATR